MLRGILRNVNYKILAPRRKLGRIFRHLTGMRQDKIQVTDVPYSAHNVDVNRFSAIDILAIGNSSNPTQKSHFRCKLAIDASSKIRNLHT